MGKAIIEHGRFHKKDVDDILEVFPHKGNVQFEIEGDNAVYFVNLTLDETDLLIKFLQTLLPEAK